MARRRRKSLKTALGITQAKRKIARATGVPTTKQGRKRKAMNQMTGGAYGRYERARADLNRAKRAAGMSPKRAARRSGCFGCLTPLLGVVFALTLLIVVLLL